MSKVRDLSPEEIDSFLREHLVARVAYIDRLERPWIVPITYAYDGAALYGYSLLGAKTEGMSAHPYVCAEIDSIEDAANWCSVVLHGVYETLSGEHAEDAVRRISERIRTEAQATHAGDAAAQTYVARTGGPGMAYRIRITDRRGRQSDG